MVKQVEKSKTKDGEASLGVRTRAQTSRFNQLKESSAVGATTEDTCYLQLRSRRLERPPVATRTRNASTRKRKGVVTSEKNDHEAPIVELGEINERTSTKRVPANMSFCAAARFTNVAKEFDDFFDHWQKRQIEKFTKKYNYDFVNDKPLQGRFEWEEIKPSK